MTKPWVCTFERMDITKHFTHEIHLAPERTGKIQKWMVLDVNPDGCQILRVVN